MLDGKSWEKMNLNVGNAIVLKEFDANHFTYASLPLLLPNRERNLSIYTDGGDITTVEHTPFPVTVPTTIFFSLISFLSNPGPTVIK